MCRSAELTGAILWNPPATFRGFYEDQGLKIESTHHVLTDAEVNTPLRLLYRLCFRLRLLAAILIYLGGVYGASLAIDYARTAENFAVWLVSLISIVGTTFGLLLALNYLGAASSIYDPLNTTDLATLTEIAEEAPVVRAFVAEALRDGRTFRLRDLNEALRIEAAMEIETARAQAKAKLSPDQKTHMNLLDQALAEAPSMIFRTLAEAHDFDLMHLSAHEAHRLSAFLAVLDQAKYPRLQPWPEKVFLSARLGCQIELQRLMQTHGINGPASSG